MRYAQYDTFKSRSQLRNDCDKVCCIDGCNEPVTPFKGPGCDVLCRDHQLLQREYGGTGRLDRPHTFHRRPICDCCGRNVKQEVAEQYPLLEQTNPDMFNRLWRNRVIGDHIIRLADGGSNRAENIQSLCLDCNSDKTILNNDWRKRDAKEVLK